MREKRVLIVATSRKTRGGITSVVKAHEQGEQWKKYHCRWIETHRDKGAFVKFLYFLRGFVEYLFLLPFYDLVHIHVSEPPSAMRKRMFLWYAKIWKKKAIVHFHSFSMKTTIHSKYKGVYRYLFEGADCVVVLSEFWKRAVKETFTKALVKVIYNPCVPKSISNKNNIPIGENVNESPKPHSFLYAGAVNDRKGYADMIKAFATVAKEYSDWRIVFAGNGDISKGKAMAESFGITRQVVWLGWVDGTAKDRAFREATVFCLPSYAEGFPMSVLDAWMYGLPVITTPVGGIPDVAKDGENMLLFNPGDVEALAACMKRMMESEQLRKDIGKESLCLANGLFNIKNCNAEIEKLYAEILAVGKNNYEVSQN